MAENTDYEIVDGSAEVSFELSVQTLPRFIDNRETFFKYLDLKLEEFKGIELTEETVKDGKDTVARLRRMKELIETKRKAVKKEILAPYESVEAFCKDANGRIDRVIEPITAQLDTFEQKRIEEKRAEIEAVITEQLNGIEKPQVARFINTCKFLRNPQWLNSTYAMSKVKKDVQNTVSKVLQDIDVLAKTLTDNGIKAVALETYKDTGDVAQTIAAYNSLASAAEQSKRALEEAQTEARTEEPKPQKPVGGLMYTYHFDVNMTEEQFGMMLTWFKQNGIHGQMRGKEIYNAEH